MPHAALRPPVPPFTWESATAKVRKAEDAWNGRNPHDVSLAYTADCRWRNRSQFMNGRGEIIAFLTRKWADELEYRLIKSLWSFHEDRIGVRFVYEWHDHAGQWFRAHGNENWLFDADGLMRERHASINDVAIGEAARLFRWDRAHARPHDHPGLEQLGL